MWRIITRRVATLREIEEHFDINDVTDANEALDLLDEAERRAHDAVKGAR